MKRLAWIFCLLFQALLTSQNIHIETLDIKKGLPDNSVRHIIQDRHGYLWFGTLNGLSRFDGNNFKNYQSIPGDTTSLTNSRMVKIKEDKKGFIWCWSDDSNLQRVNPITNEVVNLKTYLKEIQIKDFRIVSNGDIWVWGKKGCARIVCSDTNNDFKVDILNKKHGFSIDNIHFVFEDKSGYIWIGAKTGLVRIGISESNRTINTYFKGYDVISFDFHKKNIWFGTLSNGFYKYSTLTNDFEFLDEVNQQIGKQPILSINQLNTNIVLIGSQNTLFEYHITTKQLTAIHHDKFNRISKFFIDSYNNVWIITRNRGILRYSSISKHIDYFDLNGKERDFLGTSDKLKILEDSNKNIWIGVHGGGLFLYDRVKNSFINYKYDEEKYGSLSSDIILTLFEDASKNLWVGTMYGGINKINVSKNHFIWHRPIKTLKNAFENEIRTLVEDKNGNLWLGSKGGKIFYYKNYKLQFTFPDDLPLIQKKQLKNINVYSLFIDHDNNLWIGSKGKGLFVIKDVLNTNLNHSNIIHFDAKTYTDLNDVYAITQDKYKNYWVGSHSRGLTVLSDPFNNLKIKTYKHAKTPHALLGNYIRYLFFDHDDNLWIGSSDGLNMLPASEFLKENPSFVAFENLKNNITSLSFNAVDHIFQASDKSMYISTMGGGINVLSYEQIKKKHYAWKHLTKLDGLSSNKIFAIQEDADANIWISTNLGLNKYDPKTNKFDSFFVEKIQGLNYFTEGTAYKLSHGDFLFGHHKGFLTFNPKSIAKDTTTYPIVLSKLFINGNEELPRASGVIKKNIEYENEINLTYTQNTIRFDFSVLDFKNPEKIQYTYKLDGFDKNWSVPLTNNTATYQNLPNGNYTFLLKATNSDGVELPEILKFKVNITPPFFKSPLGYLIITVLFGIIFFSFLYLYKRQLSAKHEVLFADKLNEKKLKYYTNISHEFKTPLSLISCHLEDIMDDTSISETTKYSSKQIQKSTNYLLNLVEQVLDFRKIREKKMKLFLIHTDIVLFIKNIYSQFMPLAKKERINLIFNTSEKEIFGYIDIRMLKKIIYNLLSNAIKFTPENKSVTITLKRFENNRFIKIKVKDQGIGISTQDQKNLFERFSKSENSSGIGLFYVKELINCHKGSITVDSTLKKGTRFTIVLPITKAFYNDNNIEIKNRPLKAEKIANSTEESHKTDEKETQTNTILIIDDNDEMRHYLGQKFKTFFKVFTAKHGEEGVKLAIIYKPDIIVCDLMMPVLDGIGAIKLLKENFNTCHIPIILLTANATENKKVEGIKIGADDYITKPFNFKYLKLKIDALIQQRYKIIQSLSKNPELSMSIITNSKADKDFVEKVKQIVEESLGEPNFNVNYIASKTGLSRTGFYKKIKDITGETPHEFISTIQMKKAALLLKSTNYTIKDVSTICGFNDNNYFSKIFKKYFGKSPKTYQLDHKKTGTKADVD